MQIDNHKKFIYLISGPLGVGKSTVSKELARRLEHSVLLEGDLLLHMFKGEPIPSWEERLHITWKNILAVTRNFIQHDLNVVIDFVVEDEFDWFCKEISDWNVRLKYAVLRADKEKIRERLSIRGDLQSLERSLFLLNKLETSSFNAPFLCDTTRKKPDEIAEEIIRNSGWEVILPAGYIPKGNNNRCNLSNKSPSVS